MSDFDVEALLTDGGQFALLMLTIILVGPAVLGLVRWGSKLTFRACLTIAGRVVVSILDRLVDALVFVLLLTVLLDIPLWDAFERALNKLIGA